MDSTVETKESQANKSMFRSIGSGEPVNVPIKKNPDGMMALRESERTGRKIEPTTNVEFKKAPEIGTILLLDVNGDRHYFKIMNPEDEVAGQEFPNAVFATQARPQELSELRAQNKEPKDMADYLTNVPIQIRLG